MTYDSSNVFARILRGEIPSSKVYEDEFALAFRDVAPTAPTHILVIPKGEYRDFSAFAAQAPAALVQGRIEKSLVIDTLLPENPGRFSWGGHLGAQMHKPVVAEIERDARFAMRMLAGISRRLHGLVRDVEAYALHSGVKRVIGYLLRDLAGNGSGDDALPPRQPVTVSLEVSKATVASRLSLTPEYFSRVLHELEDAGLIVIDKREIRIWWPAARLWVAGIKEQPPHTITDVLDHVLGTTTRAEIRSHELRVRLVCSHNHISRLQDRGCLEGEIIGHTRILKTESVRQWLIARRLR